MAEVAPAQPELTTTDPSPADEAAAAAGNGSSDPIEDEDHHPDDEHNSDEEHEEEEHEEEVKEWDEGGKSHCGYGETVHETLMSIGANIHKVVGEPSEGVQNAMKSIGNWFQEASYAARDLKRGKMDVAGETAAAMKSVVSGDEDENKEEEGEEADGEHPAEDVAEGEDAVEPLETVAEEKSDANENEASA